MIYCDLFFAFLNKDLFYFLLIRKLVLIGLIKKNCCKKTQEKYDNGGKEKAAKYYKTNKDAIKEKAKNKYKNLPEKEKEAKKYFYNIKMSEQTLNFDDIVANKKEFHASKQAFPLNLVNTNKTVVTAKFKHIDDGSRFFIDYLHDDDVIRPFCIILPQMSGYITCFDNAGKAMAFKIKDERAYLKYTEIWNKINKLLNTRFHSQPIYDDKYIKTKVKAFSSMINTLLSDNEIPKDRNHYICIAAICIDSVLRIEKKNYPQVYLEQYNCKIKRRKPVDFFDAEADLSSNDSNNSDNLDD